MANASVRVYVDNCLISLITELRNGAPTVSQAEIDGLDRLCDDPSLEFVTSEQTLEEMKRAAGRLRVALRFIYRLMGLSTVAMQPIQVPNAQIITAAGRSRLIQPAFRPDETYERLRAIFRDDDARHILNAARAGCDVFLTLDVKTIVRPAQARRPELTAMCGPMEFLTPNELATKRMLPAATP